MLRCKVLHTALVHNCDIWHICLTCKYTTGTSEHAVIMKFQTRPESLVRPQVAKPLFNAYIKKQREQRVEK